MRKMNVEGLLWPVVAVVVVGAWPVFVWSAGDRSPYIEKLVGFPGLLLYGLFIATLVGFSEGVWKALTSSSPDARDRVVWRRQRLWTGVASAVLGMLLLAYLSWT